MPLTPIRCLYRAVDLYGKKTGVVSGDRRFTYAEFGERCERLAAGLPPLGVQPGDRVAYLSFNNNQLLEGYYGPLLAGAIVDAAQRAAHARRADRHPEPRRAPRPDLRKRLRPARRTAPPGLPRRPSTGSQIGRSLTKNCSPSAASTAPTSSPIDENAIAELFYTSGCTGTPKGVMLSHRTLYLHALAVVATFAHTRRQGRAAHHPAVPRQRLGTRRNPPP